MNPFADFEMQKVGYVDTNASGSVVQTIKKSVTISAPAGDLGANWRAHIFNTPLCETVNLAQAIRAGSSIAVGSSAPVPVIGAPVAGPITILTSYGGGIGLNLEQAAAFPYSAANTTGITSQTLAPDGFTDGTFRVIGQGFEIHNTTSKLNVQGTITVYRQPQTTNYDRTALNVGYTGTVNPWSSIPTITTKTGSQGTLSAMIINDAPYGSDDAMLLEGSRQWEARLGAMVVPTLNCQDLPALTRSPVQPCFIDRRVDYSTAGITIDGVLASSPQRALFPSVTNTASGIVPGPCASLCAPDRTYSPFNSSGVILDGLSQATTLTITAIFIIERFPAYGDTNLLVLANPSPPYDPMVMELYSSVMHQLPVAVKVGDNADGDWFFQGAADILDFLEKPLALVHPALGVGAGVLSSMAKKKVSGDPPANAWGAPKPRKKKPKKKRDNWTNPTPAQARLQAQSYDPYYVPPPRPKKSRPKRAPARSARS